jgi:diaminopimelate epimerase
MASTKGINPMTAQPTNSSTRFHKYHALGNDMVVIDPAHFTAELTPQLIQRVCDRHFGVGADGICYGPLPQERPRLVMRFFNPDGSEAEKSGNGLRIFARYLWDAGYVNGSEFEMWIGGERIGVWVEDEAASQIRTALGRVSFSRPFTPRSLYESTGGLLGAVEPAVNVTAVNVGNPHCVLFVDAVSAERIREIGPLLETAAPFPNRTNVQLAQVVDKNTIRIEIWERGAGYTLASGTSASAAAGAAVWNGFCSSPVKVEMAGGSAGVAIDENWMVELTGSVQPVFSGILSQSFTG